jgi:outer membrane protein
MNRKIDMAWIYIAMSCVLAIVVGISIASILNSPPKIAYVESGKILENFSEAIKAQKKYETEIGKMESELKVIQDSLNAALESIKTGYDKATKEKRKVLTQNLDKWNKDYAKYSKFVQESSVSKRNEIMQPVVEKINGFLEIWGHEHKYAIIFGTTAGGNIVHADKKYDVTMPVLEAINEHYKQ